MTIRVRAVHSSGDTSGDTDTAAIQAAIDDLVTTTSTVNSGMVVLTGGRYYINDTLTFNSRATHSTALRILLNGLGVSTIRVVEGFAGTYAIEYYGAHGGGLDPCISGLWMSCNWGCRGILMYHQAYRRLMDSIYWYRTNEIGVDLIDCWGSQMSNCIATEIRGIGLRAHRFNSSSITDCRFSGNGCWHTSSASNATLWVYDCLNGRDAAITEYGEDYNEAWPATDDTYVTDGTSTAVQTTEEMRGCLSIQGNLVDVRNLNCELTRYCSYPVIFAQVMNSRFALIRLENAYNGYTRFILDGQTTSGRNVEFSNVYFRNASLLGAGNAQHVLVLRNYSVGARLVDSQLAGFAGPLVYAEDGTHTQVSVERVFTESDTIAVENYTGAAEGAVITGEIEAPE